MPASRTAEQETGQSLPCMRLLAEQTGRVRFANTRITRLGNHFSLKSPDVVLVLARAWISNDASDICHRIRTKWTECAVYRVDANARKGTGAGTSFGPSVSMGRKTYHMEYSVQLLDAESCVAWNGPLAGGILIRGMTLMCCIAACTTSVSNR
ncbi:hypothetical protein VTK26DRAFT_1161 [Humicola hyalothermophila]